MAYEIIVVSEKPTTTLSDVLMDLIYLRGIPNIMSSNLTREIRMDGFHVIFLTPYEFMMQTVNENQMNAMIFGVDNLELVQVINPNQTAIPTISVADYIANFDLYFRQGLDVHYDNSVKKEGT